MRIQRLMRFFLAYLKAPRQVHANDADSELIEEIEFHLQSSFSDKLNAGYPADESRQLALSRFGDVGKVLQQCTDLKTGWHLAFHRAHQFLTLALLVAVCWLSISHYWPKSIYQSATVESGIDRSQLSGLATASGYSASDTSGDIKGSVVGLNGNSVAGANVLAVVKTWPANGYRQQSYMTTTRPDGSFSIDNVYSPAHEYEVMISVIAEGHLLVSDYKEEMRGELAPIQFQLQPSRPLELRFESSEGSPIAGVSAFPFQRIDDKGQDHCVYFCCADPIVQKSGTTGHVSMPHFLPGESATIYVRFPNQDWHTRELVIPENAHYVIVQPGPADVTPILEAF